MSNSENFVYNQSRPTLVNVSSDETLFVYLLWALISVLEILSIDGPYARICVRNKVKKWF